jgi:hypothetical protein
MPAEFSSTLIGIPETEIAKIWFFLNQGDPMLSFLRLIIGCIYVCRLYHIGRIRMDIVLFLNIPRCATSLMVGQTSSAPFAPQGWADNQRPRS